MSALAEALVNPRFVARFYSYVIEGDGCWSWSGPVDLDGYGRVSLSGQYFRAHRIAFALANGGIADGVLVDHRCRVKICTKPSHLRQATHQTNAQNLGGPTIRSTSGILGVARHSALGKWQVQINSNGKSHYVGVFDALNEAGEAAKAKRLELFTYNDADRTAE